jgi:hypothetical protein
MKKIIFIILTLAIFTGTLNAMAYNVSIVPSGSLDVTGQSTIFFDIVFNPDIGGNLFDTYGFSLFYDTTELSWNSDSTITYPPSPLTQIGLLVENTSGLIENFNGIVISGTPPTLTAATTLATVAFDVVTPGINIPRPDGAVDLWFNTSGVGQGFTIDTKNIPISQMTRMETSDVFITPEPVSSLLFVVGGMILAAKRYLKRKKNRFI